ncbi:MAG TPA: site-specific DNA-methyltransferase [Conexibacter sp.]|nr:site-specific DNA-methyltransferase [Conexibacter sp.]
MSDSTDVDVEPELTRLALRSADVVAPRVEQLAELFPEAVRDGRLDLDALRAALGDVVDDGPERFGLSWPGKRDAIRAAQTPSEATLVPLPEQSADWETTQNVIVEGETLEVLKLLQRSYHRAVRLVYIDPPYNTGKDFVYPDNFRDPLEEYLRYSGQLNGDGGRLRANTETGGRFHSAWLSMMWPRLHLARSLLRDDGVVVVSIDDGEAPRLRMVLDEVFGEENFVAQLVWEGGRKNDARFVSVGHDYMLVYARDLAELRERVGRWQVAKPGVRELQAEAERIRADHDDDYAAATAAWREYLKPLQRRVKALARASELVADAYPEIAELFPELRHPLTELPGARYNRIDARGAFRADNLSWPGGGGPTYDVLHPETGKPVRKPSRGWLYDEQQMARLIAEDRIDFKEDETGVPEYKRYLADVETEVLTSVFYRTRTRAQQQLNLLMEEDVFDFPKDVDVLGRIVEATTDRDSLVLDFFAGSGTLAEACMAVNAQDGGSRRFLLVQLPEPLERGRYTSIGDLCRERVRRAQRRFRDAAAPGSLGANAAADGFRAFALDASAFRAPTADAALQLFGESVATRRDDEALLAEVLLARGFELTAPTVWLAVGDARAASVLDGALVACFAREMSVELFEALVALEPAQLVVLEGSFGGNDEVKVNALQHLKTVNAHRDTTTELLVL